MRWGAYQANLSCSERTAGLETIPTTFIIVHLLLSTVLQSKIFNFIFFSSFYYFLFMKCLPEDLVKSLADEYIKQQLQIAPAREQWVCLPEGSPTTRKNVHRFTVLLWMYRPTVQSNLAPPIRESKRHKESTRLRDQKRSWRLWSARQARHRESTRASNWTSRDERGHVPSAIAPTRYLQRHSRRAPRSPCLEQHRHIFPRPRNKPGTKRCS